MLQVCKKKSPAVTTGLPDSACFQRVVRRVGGMQSKEGCNADRNQRRLQQSKLHMPKYLLTQLTTSRLTAQLHTILRLFLWAYITD